MKATYRKDHDKAHDLKIEFVQALLTDAEKLIKTAAAKPDIKLMKTWFGTRNIVSTGSEAYKAIVLGTAFLARWCDESGGVVHFVGKNYAGSLAACNWTNDERVIFLNSAFPMKRWSWGERVCTVLHEFSHKVLETKDETYKSKPAYGMRCVTMAQDVSDYELAITNAENWGYYLCSYRVHAGMAKKLFDRKDTTWQWLHKSHWMGGRTPFLSDKTGQQIDRTLLNGVKRVVKKKSIKMVSKSKEATPVVKKPLKKKSKKSSTKVLCPHCGSYFPKVSAKWHIPNCPSK